MSLSMCDSSFICQIMKNVQALLSKRTLALLSGSESEEIRSSTVAGVHYEGLGFDEA